MDYTFPPELFTSYFNSGPPNSNFAHNVGGWGVYGQVKEASSITKQHGVRNISRSAFCFYGAELDTSRVTSII